MEDIDIFSEEFCQNRYKYYSSLRNKGTIIYSQKSKCWLVLAYNEASEILSDHRRYSSKPMSVEDPVLLGADIPEHTQNRQAIKDNYAVFGKRENSSVYEEEFKKIAQILLKRIGTLKSYDMIGDYVIPYATSAGLLISGLRDALPEYNILLAGNNLEVTISKLILLYNNWGSIDGDLSKYIEHADNKSSVAGKLFSDERIYSTYDRNQFLKFMKTLVIAGSETPSGLLSASIFTLLNNRDVYDIVENNFNKYIYLFMDEVLRFYSPGQITFRSADEDIILPDAAIKKEDLVAIMIGAANRDADIFDDPDKFDILRNNSSTLSFGKGIHYCIGSHAGKLSVSVALKECMKELNGLKISNSATRYVNSPQVFRIAELQVERKRKNFLSILLKSNK